MIFYLLLAAVAVIGFTVFFGAPYVPSKRKDIAVAFDQLYKLTPADIVVDIGSGDGIVLREVSRRGAHAIGYELHPLLVAISKFLSRGDDKVMVVLANFWNVEIPANTTVVYTFGDSRDIQKMYDKVQHEATRIGHALSFITYGFTVGDLRPDKTVGAHHLYTVAPLQSA